MSSKTKRLIGILLALVLIAFWFIRSRCGPTPEKAEAAPQAPDIETVSGIASAQPKESPLPPSASGAKPPADGLRQWLQNVHPPIKFYGKVVDQDGEPVVGASIEFLWTHVHPEEDFRTNAISDAAGLFSLANVSGASLDVTVQKPGYYPIRSLNLRSFKYTQLPGDDPFQPDPYNPVVFHLRKKGPGADLITSRQGFSPDLQVMVPRDGVAVGVDLLRRKVGQGGQLEISQLKPEYFQARRATNWSFQLALRDGGFIEQRDEFPFQAPENGYQRVVAFEFQKGNTNWATSFKRNYYITFGQPARHGWLSVETDIGWGGFRLHYVINPTGSRNLEPMEPKPVQRELPPGVREVIPDYGR
jgi:hypothetical protein